MHVRVMAFVHSVPIVPTANCLSPNNLCNSSSDEDHRHQLSEPLSHSSEIISFSPINNEKKWAGNRFRSRVPAGLPHLPRRWRSRSSFVVARYKLNASDVRIVDTSNSKSSRNNDDNDCQMRWVEIPVTCYQIVGVQDQAEKDEIVKSVMDLKNAEIEEGYTTDAVVSRQNLLMDVRDKLLFEPEYAGNIKEKVPPKSYLRIPWAWLPGALCLLQEVGEEKLVLDIGRVALQHPDAKPYIHDLLLSMALAEALS